MRLAIILCLFAGAVQAQGALPGDIAKCWNVGDPNAPTIVVGFSLTRDGTPQRVRLLSSDSSDDTATNAAFEAARRAIVRCASYELPIQNYALWQNVEITFNPQTVRLR